MENDSGENKPTTCWDAFGDDEEDSNEEEGDIGGIWIPAEEVSLFLTTKFLSESVSIGLGNRKVSLPTVTSQNEKYNLLKDAIYEKISARGIQVERSHGTKVAPNSKRTDAVVLLVFSECRKEDDFHYSKILQSVVPGGWLILVVVGQDVTVRVAHSILSNLCKVALWALDDDRTTATVYSREEKSLENLVVIAVQKRSGVINTMACAWGEKMQDMLKEERRIMDEICIGRSFYERSSPNQLCKESIQKATTALLEHGVVVLRDVFKKSHVDVYAKAVLSDLDAAITQLKHTRGVDILQPGSSKDPVSYRELAMREDLRVDFRDGPSMRNLLRQEDLLLHPPAVKLIAQLACNPKGQHFGGNFGRWNFDGHGPDGSPSALHVSPIGAVVSFPGCADQAIHADTPHLFEHLDLPPHYINLFIPSTKLDEENEDEKEFDGDALVGGTAFLVGSHKLQVCERIMKEENRKERLLRLIRPSLCVGDALLFDCRVLHFGLANQSPTTRRPMLYVNITHKWFVDPKNWEDRDRIFPDLV